jgi:hypothetical protein
MLEAFVEQQYLIIENNIVTNVCIWDGDTSIWTPPAGSIALVQATTPAMIWQAVIVDKVITDWVLEQVIGAGDIGFTWDGTDCITNQPKPKIQIQPITTGTTTA